MSIPGSANALLLASTAAAAGGYQVSRSLRFNSSDSAFCSRTPAVAGNRRTWTWAGWVKRSALGTKQQIFGVTGVTDADYCENYFGSDDKLYLRYGYNTVGEVVTTQVFRDPSSWYHILFAFDVTQATAANRLRLYVNGVEVTTFSTDTRSTLNNTDWAVNRIATHYISGSPNGGGTSEGVSGYLADIHFIDGQALTPSSFTEVSATTGQLIPLAYSGSFGTNGFWLKFSDNSAATAATLGKDYSGNSNNWTPNNLLATQAIAAPFSVFGLSSNSTEPITNIGSLTQLATNVTRYSTVGVLNCVTADFGSVGSWVIYAQTFLNDPSFTGTIGISNNGTSWTSVSVGQNPFVFTGRYIQWARSGSGYGTQTLFSNLNDSDSLVDTPTSFGTDTYVGGEVRGNYATLNPLSTTNGTYTQGNLRYEGANSNKRSNGTLAVSTGKWYWEVTLGNAPYAPRAGAPADTYYNAFGFGISSSFNSTLSYRTSTDSLALGDNGFYKNFTGSETDVGTAFSSGDVLSIAVDLDINTFTFRRNNTQIATGTIGGTAGRELVPIIISYSGQYGVMDCNFGQRAFAYTAPSGFKALCDTNLPAPLTAKPSTVMDVVLYTGTGAALTPTSSLGFNPDWIWIKSRSAGTDHALYDVVRGAQARLESNIYDAEVTTDGGVTAFNSAGFTLGTLAQVNTSSATYAAWCWDAGTTTASNPDGSTTSQVRANVSAGFSVITFNSGASNGDFTVGHGLGVAPRMIIMKSRTRNGGPWWVYHASTTTDTTKYLELSTTGATITNSGGNIWGSALPTSTLFGFSVGAGKAHTQNEDIVSYCFTPVVGYSSFGSYTGNGSADGPFVYTGFRPRWILIKRTDAADDWNIFDTTRSTYNVMGHDLLANRSDSEYTGTYIDCLSNGFKIRETNSSRNASGGTYIYAAFAESPLQYSRAR